MSTLPWLSTYSVMCYNYVSSFVLLFVFLEVIIAFLFSLFRFPPTKSHSLQEPLSAVFSAGKHIILFSPLTSSSIREWWFSQSVAQLISWVFPLLSSREFSLLLSLISGITDLFSRVTFSFRESTSARSFLQHSTTLHYLNGSFFIC